MFFKYALTTAIHKADTQLNQIQLVNLLIPSICSMHSLGIEIKVFLVHCSGIPIPKTC